MPNRGLSDDQVRYILMSDKSHAELERETGISRETIRNVRSGESYASIAPDIPRRNATASCYDCINWRGGNTWDKTVGVCLFGFPDPYTEGALFARMCNNYKKAA